MRNRIELSLSAFDIWPSRLFGSTALVYGFKIGGLEAAVSK
jgi:hypothetical protein